MLSEIMDQFGIWWQNNLFKAGYILLIGLMAAILTRLALVRIFMRLAKRTRTDIDDKILATSKNPITWTIIAGSVDIAIRAALYEYLPLLLQVAIHRLLITTVVLFWFFAFMDLCNYFADWLSDREDQIHIVQPRTKPLFRILFKLVIILQPPIF